MCVYPSERNGCGEGAAVCWRYTCGYIAFVYLPSFVGRSVRILDQSSHESLQPKNFWNLEKQSFCLRSQKMSCV